MNLRDTVEEIREMAANGLAYDDDRSELKLRLIRLVEMAAIGLDRDSVSVPPVPDGAYRMMETDELGYSTVPRFIYIISGVAYRGKIRAIKAVRERQPGIALLDAKVQVEALEASAKEVL